jgi:hypothetical protein
MISACFFIPLAPKDSQRVLWTIKSIRLHCSDYRIFVLLDGTREQFSGLKVTGDDVEVLWSAIPSGGHWGQIWQMQNNAMAVALRRDDLADDCIFVRIDADALVVRSRLVERAKSILARDPTIGQLGQCHTNIAWQPLANEGWKNFFTKIHGLSGPFRMAKAFGPSQGSWGRCFQAWFRYRALLRAAVSNGYRLGEFAIGPYILRLATVRLLQEHSWLTESPFRYFVKVQDDVAMTPHVYAVGFRAADDVDENGIFAICGEEPWVHALKLRERGHYIIHPIKYGATLEPPYLTESELADALLNCGLSK